MDATSKSAGSQTAGEPYPPAAARTIAALRAELAQAQRLAAAGMISAAITHEFNNILTTIINYANLGQRQTDAAFREKAFHKILTAAQRASRITTGMLSFVRGKGDGREPTDLSRLVEDVLVLCEKDLQIHGIRLQTQLEPGISVEIQPVQIQQVVLNLIVNARQAMETGGRLFLTVRKSADGQFAEITVRDTGPGIPADKLPQIFEPFYSTKTADVRGQGGTGLGLALAREVMEAHEGRIRVESALGQGTTFTLKFPLKSNLCHGFQRTTAPV